MSELPKEYALLKSEFSISDTATDGFVVSFTLESVGLWASATALGPDLQGVKSHILLTAPHFRVQGTYLEALLVALVMAASADTAVNVCCANRASNC